VVNFRVSLKDRVRASARIKLLARSKVWVKASSGPGIGVGLGVMLFFGVRDWVNNNIFWLVLVIWLGFDFSFKFTVSAMVSGSAKDKE
jgi:hypothetical protein